MKTLVMNFGRYQGPHKGHKMLWDFMHNLATDLDAEWMVYPSHTQNKNNPISFHDKVDMLSDLMPEYTYNISVDHSNSIVGILQSLQTTYDNIVFVCGSDQYKNFNAFLLNYNGLEYDFNSIEVVVAGETRDQGTSLIAQCSASKMREYIANADMSSFMNDMPDTAPAIAIARAFATMTMCINTTA